MHVDSCGDYTSKTTTLTGVVCIRIRINLPMDALFAQEVEKHRDDDLIEFLLDTAPIYGRGLQTCDPIQQRAIIQEFQQKIQRPRQPAPFHICPVQEVTPYGCGFCHCKVVVVDAHHACLVCTNCGISGPIGYEHNVLDLEFTRRTLPYVYEPSKHLAKHLRWIQGWEMPRLDAGIVEAMTNDLVARHSEDMTTVYPFDVYRSLQRLKRQDLYQHRWALTRLLNPTYVPLRLTHELVEQILAMFSGCHKRFQDGIKRGVIRRKRNFYPYPLFIQCLLTHMKVTNIDHHFKPLKARRNYRSQWKEITSLLPPEGRHNEAIELSGIFCQRV